jgi:hypothetical protein
MLGVEVGLGTVGAWEFAVRILLGNLGLRDTRASSWRWGTSRSTRKYATATLRTYHMGRLFSILGQHRGLLHHRALAIGRVHAGLGHHTSSRHRPKNWGYTSSSRRCGCKRLLVLMHRRGRGLGHHARRHRVVLLLWLLLRLLGLLLVRILLHDITPAPSILLLLLLLLLALRRRRIRGHVVGGDRRVGGRRRPRRVWVTTVRVLHGGMRRVGGLQGRQLVLLRELLG